VYFFLRFLLLIPILLLSCTLQSDEELTEVDYGQQMFEMRCAWDDGTNDPIVGTVVYCYSFNISSEIIEADFFSLAVQYPENLEERVRICGENMNLYSGHDLYDNLLPALTDGKYGCINAFDEVKNNEFEWYWHEEERVLEFNWVPEQSPPLDMFLVIDEPIYGVSPYTDGYSSQAAIYLKKDP
jgi:hypothetical protein